MQALDFVDSRFHELVVPTASLEKLAEGFRWLEGPVWFADLKCLLFSDIPNDWVMCWTETGGVEVFRQPSNFENGHTRDREGQLISCSHHDRCVTRTESDGCINVLADCFQGKRLNSPNDVVVKSDGTIWFTDPPYGIQTDYEGGKQESELPAYVYRLDPRYGILSVVSDDFQGPNGLCFSPDEHLLYIVETGLEFVSAPIQHIKVFEVSEDGTSLLKGQVFHTVQPGHADGICCDEEGNIWTGAADGVHCISPEGTLLGKIKVPSPVINLTFGGRNRSRLFLCSPHELYAIYVNRRGAQYP